MQGATVVQVFKMHFSIGQKSCKIGKLKIPECMIKGDILYLDMDLPQCRHFMTLVHDEKFKVDGPKFTSVQIKKLRINLLFYF